MGSFATTGIVGVRQTMASRARHLGRRVYRLPAKQTAQIVNLLLCALIIWTAWGAYKRITAPLSAIANTSSTLAPRLGRADAPSVSLEQIVAAHLFGMKKAQAQAKPKVQFVPETPLDFKLDGVIALDVPASSQAVIRVGGKPPQVYGVGDTLPGGAVIHQIRSRYIVIRRGTAYESVWLARDKPTTHKQQMIAVNTARLAAARPGVQTKANGPIALTPAQRKKLLTARQAVFDNDTPVSRYVRLQAIHHNGRLAGYRVFPGVNKSLFKALRLEPGDLIVAVNGVKLSAVDTNPDVVTLLKKSDHIELGVERGGVRRALNFDLKR